MESTLVVKVKYGQTLRRFSTYLLPGKNIFDLDMDSLREKICSLFYFPFDTDLKMTYIDEDGDEVKLVDDRDVYNATKQRLKSLRIVVRLRHEKISKTWVPSARPMPLVTGSKPSKETTPCLGGGFAGNDAVFRKMSDAEQEHLNECPYCGVPLPGDFSFRWKRSFMFHSNVICDGCGAYPITQPRFKSKMKEEFELCGMFLAKIHRHPRSFWGLQNQVDDWLHMTRLFSAILQNLDKDLPQVSGLVNGCKTNDMDVEPCEDNSFQAHPADELHKSETEIYFPDQELTVPAPPESSSAAAHAANMDEKSPVTASEIPPLMHQITDVSMQAPTDGSIVNKEVEESLLEELEKLGFIQVDLNKEKLRINEYNSEQTVDDLSGVSEWDLILEELEEMERT